MINKKVRVYQTPLERASTSYDTEVHQEIIHQEKNFYNVLFDNIQVGKVIERRFLIKKDDCPIAFIKSFIPCIHSNIKSNECVNLEKEVDDLLQGKIVKKEFSLTWPTNEEAEILHIIGDGQIIVEKQYLLNRENKIIRYEEESSSPETFFFEE